LQHIAHGQHFGVGRLPLDLDVRIALVVLQPDVEVRLVALDEIRFEQQRFQLGVGDDPLEIGNLGDEALRLGRVIAGGVKVRSDAVAQIDGFADVDDLAARVEVLIDAGFGRQGFEFLGDLLVGDRTITLRGFQRRSTILKHNPRKVFSTLGMAGKL